jgi:hypothetical protein
MKLETKIEALGYLRWYMDLLAVHIALFGMYSSNYFILVNKICLLCKYNKIDLDTFTLICNKSKLVYFGIDYNNFTELNELQLENMN